MIILAYLASAQISPSPSPSGAESDREILITAALVPVAEDRAPPSVTSFDETLIDELGLRSASDFLRLAPGVSVATSGARGTETVVRIRGAESNHTLIFVDGIAFNDIAAANAARFDSLSAGALDRIELIRGPQSALWGSEALGGVVSLQSPEPLGKPSAEALIEIGSQDSRRAELEATSGGDQAGLSASASWVESEGIDVLGQGLGDKDGFETLTLGLKGHLRFGNFDAGAVGRFIHHDVEFDGFDPLTFRRADTADSSEAETIAGRAWIGYDDGAAWSARLEAQRLDSDNRNRLGAASISETGGKRIRFGGRLVRRLETSGSRHDVIIAIERETEKFSSRDLIGSSPARRLGRGRTAVVGEWRAEWGERLTTDLAFRHDDFSRFEDDTTVRVSYVFDVFNGLQWIGSYGEGIAQPSFTDLFGFPGFPFLGNPDLRPEQSQGFETGLRWRSPTFSIEGIYFSNDLKDEIVEDFATFPATVVNAAGKSRRRGLELSAEWRPSEHILFSTNYTYLDARAAEEAGVRLREIRRPRHSFNSYAAWQSGPIAVAGSLAYVGRRTDRDFDLFPAPIVELDDYWLSSLSLSYRLLPQVELFARAENGFDSEYQDVFGYNLPGRTVHAGLRVTLGR
jgi:vitamin B12 transporter